MDTQKDDGALDEVGKRRPIAGAVGVLTGLWLFASALLWPNESTASYNALVTAGLVVTVALALAQGLSLARLALGASGCWILVSIRVLSIFDVFTRRNYEVVGVLLIVLALIPESLREAFKQSYLFRRRLSPKQ